ncbi:hypothetical protein Hanom_Chr14g01263601 [Helianthus anomalus]
MELIVKEKGEYKESWRYAVFRVSLKSWIILGKRTQILPAMSQKHRMNRRRHLPQRPMRDYVFNR